LKTKKSVDLIYDKSVIDFKLGVMREVNTFLEKEVDENNEKTGKSFLKEETGMELKDFFDSAKFDLITKEKLFLLTINFEFELSNEELVEKFDLKEKLPVFQVMNENGLAYTNDKTNNENSFFSKNFNNLKKQIIEIKGQEYLDNMDMNDIRSWEELANSGTVQIYYNAKDEKGNSELINYTGFEYEYTNYSQKTVVKEIEERFTKVGKEIKEELKSLVKDGKYIENKDNKELYLKYFNQSLELFEEYDNQRKEERREFMRNNDKENIKKKIWIKKENFNSKERKGLISPFFIRQYCLI
jgi:hypothetical protein